MFNRVCSVRLAVLFLIVSASPVRAQEQEDVAARREMSLFEAFDNSERGARLATDREGLDPREEKSAIEEVQYQYESRSRRRPAATDKSRLQTSGPAPRSQSTAVRSKKSASRSTKPEPAPIVADELRDEVEPAPVEPAPVDADLSLDEFSPEPLTPKLEKLRGQIRRTLVYYYGFPLNTSDHNPWEVMHSIIAYGVDSEVRRGQSGPRTNAIRTLCNAQPCHGERLLELKHGQLSARKGPYVQGHHGQFLAILAQSHLRDDFPLRVGGRDFTLEDLIEFEKLGCEHNMELTFKLIALSHYLELDDKWKNTRGEDWSIPKLIREELKSPIRGAACGGTHRLMGLSYAVAKRRARGEPIDGEFRRAERFVREYQQYTLRMQNPDGSFSTAWFKNREARPDLDRRVQTTGHILEWMVFSLSDDELRDPRVVNAVSYLTGVLLNRRQTSWEIGPLGHALHALALYDERVFGPFDEPAPVVASRPERTPSTTKETSQKTDSSDSRNATGVSDEDKEKPTSRRNDPAATEPKKLEEANDEVAPPLLLAPPPAESLSSEAEDAE